MQEEEAQRVAQASQQCAMEKILKEMVSSFARERDRARLWYGQENTKRNSLAQEAAESNYNDAVAIVAATSEKSTMLEKLDARSRHAEFWKCQFATWGGHDNAYARQVHETGENNYNEAIRRIMSLD